MTPSLTPTVSYIYYSNTEYDSDSEGIFLDNNMYIRKNPSTDLVDNVFSTPGDVLITGNVIYQGDSIYAQASADPLFAPPVFGTSTRNLNVTDQAGNTVFNSTTPYTTYNINTTFSIVGGRNYYVRGRTDYVYPTTAVLYIFSLSVVLHNGEYYRTVTGDLSNPVDGSFTIKGGPGSGVSGNLYDTEDCTFGFNTSYFYTAEDLTMNKGFYGFFSMRTDTQYFEGYNSFQFLNYIEIDNGGPNPIGLNNGQTFVVGTTTVTVSIPPDCFAFA
jgi:hypothetical protein